jgi:hypothetical protein
MIDSKGYRFGVSVCSCSLRVPKIGVATQTSSLEALMDAGLDTLATALYVRIEGLAEGRLRTRAVAPAGRDLPAATPRR